MSKITRIENELITLNDSVFHRLCSSLIHHKFNYKITDKGLAKGSDKPSKGTPDSYILDNGKTIFIEVTTQKSGVYDKFIADIDKCLQLNKKGLIIDAIFLCYNLRLSETEKNNLLRKGYQNQVLIEFLTLDEIKYDLYRDYGFIAKEFLGIEIDSGQILDTKIFVTENNQKTTSLENPFISRENEKKNVITNLEDDKVVILSGNPGTGKTRLALEVSNELTNTNKNLKAYIITSKGQSIYIDLQSNFLPNNEYLIIVDDANRIEEFNRILELYLREELSIKLIITARNYSIRKIKRQLEEYKSIVYETIKIEKLSTQEIKNILTSISITHPICVGKITHLANGNPRLAMMAAEHVKEKDDCNSINNVSDIYNRYFRKYIDEIDQLQNRNILKTLGIISFLRNVDKEDEKLTDKTLAAFEIDENEFWENIYTLHGIELVDVYERTIVKISDQVIAEYFFFYVFIEKGIIDFSVILNTYLSDYSGKIRDNLYPILNSLDRHKIIETLRISIDQFYEKIKNNEDLMYKFFDVFWFDKKTEVLIWLSDKIDTITKPQNPKFDFNEKKELWDYNTYPYLELIKLFGYSPDENFRLSLELLFNYLFKKPNILPDVQFYLKEGLSFNSQSHNYHYYIQTTLFDLLFEKANEEDNSIFYKELIIELSNKYLQIYFENTSNHARERNVIEISHIALHPTDEIKEIRSKIWEFLIDEYENFEDKIISVLSKYINQSYPSIFRFHNRQKQDTPQKEIVRFDQQFVVRFFEEKLSEYNYLHCVLLDDYTDNYEDWEEDLPHLKKRYTNRIYELSLVLKWDFIKLKRNDDVSTNEELKELKKREIISYFENYEYEQLLQLIDDIEFLISVKTNYSYSIQKSLELILFEVAKRDTTLIIKILIHLIERNNSVKFNPYQVIEVLMKQSDLLPNDIFKLLNQNNKYSDKCIWIQMFFYNLNEDDVNKYYYDELIKIYANWENNYNVNFDFWNKFKKIDPNIFTTIFKLLLNKTKESHFNFDFHYWSLYERFISEFKKEIEVLKSLYLYQEKSERSFDHDYKYLKKIVEIDTNFLFEFLIFMFSGSDYYSSRNNQYRMDFIWELDNYELLIEKSIDVIKNKFSLGDDAINFLFPPNLNEKVDSFIMNYILKHIGSEKKLRKIFNVITYSYSNKRIAYLSFLKEHINNVEIIESLELVENSKTGGSLIPFYEADRKFWVEVEKLFSTHVRFLKIKAWAKSNQLTCERIIEWQRRMEFTRDF